MVVASTLRPIFNLTKRYIQPVISSTIRSNSSTPSTSSDKNILKSPFENTIIPNLTIPELIYSKIEKFGNYVATECPITGRKYTYEQLEKYSKNLAGSLRKKLKLNKGDVVGILLPNSPEYAFIAVGILHAGLIATTINPHYTPDEISRQLNDSSAKAVVTYTELYPIAKDAMEKLQKPLYIITTKTTEGQPTPNGAINLQELITEKIDLTDTSSCNDIAIMPYSSGTTGLPKGVMLTHKNIVSNLTQLDEPKITYLQKLTKDHQDIIPAVLPHFHIYGLTVTLLLTLLKGCKNICLPKFEPKLFIETLIKDKPNMLFVAPPLIIFMSTHPAIKPEYLTSIRAIISGAAPLGATDEETFLNKANKDIKIGQGFGMTETSPAISITTNDKKSTKGSTGPPIPNTEIKIKDLDSSLTLGPNQIGELLVRGPQVMKGYHNNDKSNKETFDKDWLKTGDIAFYDENNCLTITDRLKELIKVKGFQVPPAELEEIIRKHPDVLEVGVIGIPHKRDGEVPKAFIVMKPGTKFNEENIKNYVKNKVANYKELRGGVSVIDNLPKNPSGKILRRKLKELHNST